MTGQDVLANCLVFVLLFKYSGVRLFTKLNYTVVLMQTEEDYDLPEQTQVDLVPLTLTKPHGLSKS